MKNGKDCDICYLEGREEVGMEAHCSMYVEKLKPSVGCMMGQVTCEGLE